MRFVAPQAFLEVKRVSFFRTEILIRVWIVRYLTLVPTLEAFELESPLAGTLHLTLSPPRLINTWETQMVQG